MSILAIVIPLGLLVFLIWKRINVVIAAVICTALMALMSGMNIFQSITKDYMTSFSGYILNFWPLIFLGASFGKAMELGGGAEDLANLLVRKLGTKYTIPILGIIGFILSYGGVSVFVTVFVMLPITLTLFKRADLPRKMLTGAIAAGAFTGPSIGPGSPSIMNILPMKYFGTTAYELPLYSAILTILYTGLAILYMMWEEKRARKNGWHFEDDEMSLKMMAEYEKKGHGNGLLALIPMAVVIVPLFFRVDVLIALLAGWISIAVIYWNKIDNKVEILNCGISGATTAILATAAVVGFGGVAKLTPGYTAIIDFTATIGGNPLVSFATATGLMAGATGSGSGGLALSLEMLAAKYMAMGVHPGLLHKIASIAACTLDSLPHNGVQVTLLAVCGLTHKEGYRYQFVITVLISIVVLILAIILGSIFYPVTA